MKKKYNLLVKNIGLFTIGSFGSKLVSFFMVPLYTAILRTSDYGTVDLIYSTISMLTPILLLSIQDATLRFGMDPQYQKEDVISTTFGVIFKGSLILLLGLVLTRVFGMVSLSNTYYFFFFFTFVIGAMNNCLSLYLKAKNEASIIAVSGILCTVFTCLGNFLLLVVFKLGIDGYMLANAIGLGVQFLYQFLVGKTYKDIHFRNYNNISKPMIKYSTPLISNSIAWWVNNASDRYILTWISGVAVNGIYSISYKIPTILTMFQSIFYNAWSISAISEFDKEDLDGFIGHNYRLYSFVSIGVCSVLLLFNIPLAGLLYSGEYFQAWKCVPFLLVGTVFNGISQFEGALFAAVKKTKKVSITTVTGAVMNTILNLVMIPYFGAVGAAFSTMLGYLVMWVLRTIFVREFICMKVDWAKHGLAIGCLIVQAVLTTCNVFLPVQVLLVAVILLLHSNEMYRKK